ncbi:unnamed protein product [Durusdinium trenchii]|uniref:Uncharacterized protein n=1 Tax=Durusdinium trenchii TaxID=1381693 RepID=A0ABP0S2H9_9DINO
MLTSSAGGMSLLDELIACVHYRILLCMDEGALSSMGSCSHSLHQIARSQALWQRLAMCRDRLAAARFLGSFSPDARRPVVTTEGPSPYLPCSRFVPSSMHSGASGALNGEGTIDWRDVCRHLNKCMAERPWEEVPEASNGRSAALWTDLTDDGNGADDGAPNEPPPTGATLLGSQSPHVFWIGGDRLLGLAGGYSPDVVGGSAIHPLREIYLMDLPDISDSHATLTRPDLSVKKLDCGTANGRLPHGHPSVNGCACDFDALRSTIFFFGGGTPHAEVYHATSALRLEGWDGANPTAQWQVVSSPGSIESDEIPLARQGVKGTVYCDEFVIFGGRLQGGRCTNDVWSLNLEGDSFSSPPTLPWRRLDCDGQAPSPRVWHSACQAVHGQWFIYGGSTWQFEEPAEPHDFRSLFVLHIAERRWSSLAAASPTRPPWAVAACLLPLGCCQLLLLGGTLPHKLGATGLNAHSLRHWRSWYNRLDEPWVFDLRSGEWTPRGAAVALPSDAEDREQHVAEVYLRSHFAAVFVPSRRSALVLGGSRYFTGEYFNDLLELQLPSSTSSRARRCGSSVLGRGRQESQHPLCGPFQAPNGLPRHLQVADGREASLTRGFVGRLRGMLQEGIISQEQFNLMRSPG